MVKESESYELSYLLKPTIAEDELNTRENELKKIIEEAKGTVESSDFPKKRPLSYSIEKESSAFFGVFRFVIDPQSLKLLREKINEIAVILRYLIVVWEKPEQKTDKIAAPAYTPKQE